MTFKMPIKKITSIPDKDLEMYHYTNEKMLSRGVFISEFTYENGRVPIGQRGCLDTTITVSVLTELPIVFVMYEGDYLNCFEGYIRIKAIVDLFNENEYDDFYDALKHLSMTWYNDVDVIETMQYLDEEIWKPEIE